MSEQKPPAEFNVPGSLMIRRQRMREGPSPVWILWKPHTAQSVHGESPESFSAILKFCQWPVGTPTGEALREWLVLWGYKRPAKKGKRSTVSPEVKATGFGPEAHLDESDPNHATKMVT